MNLKEYGITLTSSALDHLLQNIFNKALQNWNAVLVIKYVHIGELLSAAFKE